MGAVRVRLGITPLATLHHFVHPQWFEDIGAFEKEDNIPLFLTWTELAYRCGVQMPASPCAASTVLLLRFSFAVRAFPTTQLVRTALPAKDMGSLEAQTTFAWRHSCRDHILLR